MQTIRLSLVAGTLFLWGCSGTPQPEQQTAPQPGFKPVGTVMQIMDAVIIPSSNAIWNVPAAAPKNDEEWAAVRNSAMALAESGNLLMIGDRAKDQGEWMMMAQALVDAGTAAFRAAEAKDIDAITAVGDQIYSACENCHLKYSPQPPAAGEAPPAGQ
jgi:hypothetical protein